MPMHLEHNGIWAKNFDMKEEDEDCEIKKLQMHNTKDEE
jgi:hypothetical protein